MDYSFIQRSFKGKTTKIGVIGATRGYGYTIIAQMVDSPMCRLRFICSRHPEECEAALLELGYDMRRVRVCPDKEAVENTDSDDILIISDFRLMTVCSIDTIVECTGNTAVGVDAAVLALESRINVCMVSKETDSICGAYLNTLAEENGVIYTLANGDQPRNLLDLCSWARILGLEIIAAGKSSENDLVLNPKTGGVTYLEEQPSVVAPELNDLWEFKGPQTLDLRRKALSGLLKPISADLCEMNLVSNVTGLVPAALHLNYPVARISELADIFIPKEDGGILERTGVVDVFYNFRHPDDASFAGGEFVVVSCPNQKVSDILKAKGHVVSRNGKYLCLYYPYHILGVETPATLVLMHFMGIGNHPECRQVSIMAGVAERRIPAGTVLKVTGHHHEVDGTIPKLMESDRLSDDTVPFYVLNGALVTKDIEKGETITADTVRLDESARKAYEVFRRGLKIE